MTSSPAEPRLSATILLVRDTEHLEVLMVARHYQIDFAAGALVFPGGKANEEDADPAWLDHVDGGEPGRDMAARIAAVREAFEESGILLARKRDVRGQGQPLVTDEVVAPLQALRSAIDRREMSFLKVIQDNKLVLALDTLIHFGHWITPDMMPKRFDTHFYLAPAPEAQIASHDGRETTDAVWLNPSKALHMEQAGEATIIFPTRMNLKKLERVNTCADMVQGFADEPVVTVLPVLGKTAEGKPCLIIPEEAGYGQTVELMSNVKV